MATEEAQELTEEAAPETSDENTDDSLLAVAEVEAKAESNAAKPEPSLTSSQQELLLTLQDRLDHLTNQYQDLLGRVEHLEHRHKTVASSSASSLIGEPAQEDILKKKSSPGPQALFDAARQAMEKGDLKTAREQFQQFTDKHAAHPLSNQSYYWLGEIYLLRQQHKEAAMAFSKAYQAISKQKGAAKNKQAEILYKLALSLKYLGNKKDARVTLKKLRQDVAKLPLNMQAPVDRLENDLREQ